MRTRSLLLLAAVAVVAVLLATPVFARWGTSRELARWPSTNAVYGVKRPIWLSIQRDVSYLDVLSWYPTYRFFITDGGYAYVREFDIPGTGPKKYLAGCKVAWQPEGVELLTPDGEKIFIPGQLILGRIGPN
jgi:hypothetical protein